MCENASVIGVSVGAKCDVGGIVIAEISFVVSFYKGPLFGHEGQIRRLCWRHKREVRRKDSESKLHTMST
jgi:hypothetical protein